MSHHRGLSCRKGDCNMCVVTDLTVRSVYDEICLNYEFDNSYVTVYWVPVSIRTSATFCTVSAMMLIRSKYFSF